MFKTASDFILKKKKNGNQTQRKRPDLWLLESGAEGRKIILGDIPGGTVAKNPPASAGDNPWSGKIPHATEQLSLWATTVEPALELQPWSRLA